MLNFSLLNIALMYFFKSDMNIINVFQLCNNENAHNLMETGGGSIYSQNEVICLQNYEVINLLILTSYQ